MPASSGSPDRRRVSRLRRISCLTVSRLCPPARRSPMVWGRAAVTFATIDKAHGAGTAKLHAASPVSVLDLVRLTERLDSIDPRALRGCTRRGPAAAWGAPGQPGGKSREHDAVFPVRNLFFFKQKTAYEITR